MRRLIVVRWHSSHIRVILSLDINLPTTTTQQPQHSTTLLLRDSPAPHWWAFPPGRIFQSAHSLTHQSRHPPTLPLTSAIFTYWSRASTKALVLACSLQPTKPGIHTPTGLSWILSLPLCWLHTFLNVCVFQEPVRRAWFLRISFQSPPRCLTHSKLQ